MLLAAVLVREDFHPCFCSEKKRVILAQALFFLERGSTDGSLQHTASFLQSVSPLPALTGTARQGQGRQCLVLAQRRTSPALEHDKLYYTVLYCSNRRKYKQRTRRAGGGGGVCLLVVPASAERARNLNVQQ